MSTMQQHLTEQLNISLEPVHVEVINESSAHAGPAAESHFKLVVVSDRFEDLKLLDRQRMIHNLFEEEIKIIHAFTMFTYTPSEWKLKNGTPDSPKCAG